MKEKLIPFRDTGPLDSHTKLCVCVYVYLRPSATGRLLLSSLTICSTCQRPPTDFLLYSGNCTLKISEMISSRRGGGVIAQHQ